MGHWWRHVLIQLTRASVAIRFAFRELTPSLGHDLVAGCSKFFHIYLRLLSVMRLTYCVPCSCFL